jgi:hypothetical protein
MHSAKLPVVKWRWWARVSDPGLLTIRALRVM